MSRVLFGGEVPATELNLIGTFAVERVGKSVGYMWVRGLGPASDNTHLGSGLGKPLGWMEIGHLGVKACSERMICMISSSGFFSSIYNR